jgi:8-oxo-dGTP diphosphatase
VFILPGGKPEGDESDLATLVREVAEELGCEVQNASLSGTFSDKAAGVSDAVVVVRLYTADLVGEPLPQAEIEELQWVDLRKKTSLKLAPSISNQIIPHLRKTLGKIDPKSGRLDHVGQSHVQGKFELN